MAEEDAPSAIMIHLDMSMYRAIARSVTSRVVHAWLQRLQQARSRGFNPGIRVRDETQCVAQQVAASASFRKRLQGERCSRSISLRNVTVECRGMHGIRKINNLMQ